MKKYIVFALMLTIAAQGAWAWARHYEPELMKVQPQREGPWEFQKVRCGTFYNTTIPQFYAHSKCFNALNQESFGSYSSIWESDHEAIYQWKDKDGIGFTCHQCCMTDYIITVFSLYSHAESVPPYSRIRMTWKFSVAGWGEKFNQNVALYAHDDYDVIMNTDFDILSDASNKAGAQYLLLNVGSDPDETEREEATASFSFDNLKGGATAVKTWYLMLTHAFISYGMSYEVFTRQWGAFRSEKVVSMDTTYYKMVSFDANGGSGYMKEMGFETSDVVPANAYVRDGYTFQGWATASTGLVRYHAGDAITATANDKGPVTLYAIWKAQPTTVIALINAIGEVVYTEECKEHIDAARKAYNELSSEEKAQVTNYSALEAAETLYNAADAVVKKIDAIGKVQYSDECRALIDEAQTAYDALNAEAKALVINYSQLSAAQDLYDVLKVVEKIDEIGEVVYTAECKTLIDAARTEYNALTTPAKKSQVTNYATLLAAETAYDAFGKKTVLFMEQDGLTPVGDSQLKSIVYPALPAGATEWQTEEKDVTDKTIVIKAQ